MSMVSAVAGGGVPVGAWQNRGNEGANTSYDASFGAPVLAPWAFDTPTVQPWKYCEATTKAGNKCETGKVEGTQLCYSHWKQVATVFGHGMVAVAGHKN